MKLVHCRSMQVWESKFWNYLRELRDFMSFRNVFFAISYVLDIVEVGKSWDYLYKLRTLVNFREDIVEVGRSDFVNLETTKI